MNHAFLTLGFADTKLSDITWKDIKQNYRINALRYHPDKNKSEEASTKFLEVKEAYEYLQKRWVLEEDIEVEMEVEPKAGNGYMDLLHSVLNVLAKNQKINEILEKILSICETKSIQLLENLEKRKFNIAYTILKKYRNIFSLSDDFYIEMEKIKESYSSTTLPEKKDLETITLYPTINDIWDHLVYKYVRGDQVYLVPLWHKELIYEHNQVEFIVECCLKPIDDKKIWIDEENNIHQSLTFSLLDVFEQEKIDIYYGKKCFTICPEILQLKKTQTLCWYGEGISKIMPDIHNISKKTDVYLHIYLESGPEKRE
jgi:hypothetical protein